MFRDLAFAPKRTSNCRSLPFGSCTSATRTARAPLQVDRQANELSAKRAEEKRNDGKRQLQYSKVERLPYVWNAVWMSALSAAVYSFSSPSGPMWQYAGAGDRCGKRAGAGVGVGLGTSGSFLPVSSDTVKACSRASFVSATPTPAAARLLNSPPGWGPRDPGNYRRNISGKHELKDDRSQG